jgi:DNA-binding XRE family transcriptional regulator
LKCYNKNMTKELQHLNRRLTDEERSRHARIRETVVAEVPPRRDVDRTPSPAGIPSQIRAAREARHLTWYALARLAGIPNQATIRDIEQGKDVKLSNLQAVAGALGLALELAEQRS